MKVKALAGLNPKLLLGPYKTLLSIFKFRFRRPLLIRALRLGSPRHAASKKASIATRRIRSLLHFRSRRRLEEMERASELQKESLPDVLLFPSPIAPKLALVRTGKKRLPARGREHNVEDDSCRSFEKYLVEMIVEEGRVKDLGDVEELLYCWKSLKCPVFVDLVSRFYAELCRDLFSADGDAN